MNKEAIQEAARKLSIQMVYIGGSEAKLCNDFDPQIPGQELIGQFRLGTEAMKIKELKGDGFYQKFVKFYVSAGMRYLKAPVSPDWDEEKLAEIVASEITAVFIAEYAIVDNGELSAECLNEFGRVNAPFNVWPYWREYCQSTCSRMSLPVTVIPMLKIE